MTKGEDKTKEQLISELAEMHQRIAEVEVSETERKRAEEELRESQEKLGRMLESVTDGISVVGLNGTITEVNEGTVELHGFSSRDELLGKSAIELVAPRDHERVAANMRKALKGEAVRDVEYTLLKADGSEFPGELSTSILKDASGNAVGHITILRDITERKQAEEDLRESEEKYRALFEESRDAVFITTRDGKLTSANQAYLGLFGYTREEATGLDVRKTYANPEDRLRYQQEMERKGEVKDFELRLRKKDGAELDCLLTATVRQSKDGVTLGYQGIIRDITKRKQREEQLQVLVNNTPFGLSLISKKGAYEYVNTRFTDIFGYTIEDVPTGKEWLEKTYPDPQYRQQVTALWLDDLRKAGIGELRPCTFTITCKDGAAKDILFRPVTLSSGRQLITYEDITERKRAEAEKKELEQKAQMASRLATVGEMASGIAHEINNPLTAVIGYADLVLGRDIPQEVKEDVRIIHNGAKRVADIIKRLLAFARQYQPERTYLDISDIIKTTLELRAYELETSNIKVATNLAPDLPRTMADAGQLQQVLLNLIINAETEMRLAHEGGKLSVKTETVGSTIRISFKDDGPGITKENLEKIFNPFFTTREVGKGTGLGLSLCHGIIAEHKGRLYAESKPGKGATFVVELPVITEEKQLEMAEPAEEVKKVARARILVVDDEPAICRFLERLLTGEGHEVETVASAGDALEKIKGTRYNLILLDIKLPGGSGIELYRHIKDATPSWAKRIVFITGDVMGTDTRSFLSRTKVPYITKPFDTEQLKKEVNRKLTKGA